jgi:hypothetical protein
MDGLHVVLIACLDLFLNDRRQFEVHDNFHCHECLGDNLVAHPAVNKATNHISGVKFVWEPKLNAAGFIQRHGWPVMLSEAEDLCLFARTAVQKMIRDSSLRSE